MTDRSLSGSAHRLLRGPVRTRLRTLQARHPAWSRRRHGPPDFVGIGAQRCGTSWWLSLIEQHPSVAPLGLGAKELHVFDEAWRLGPGADEAALAEQYAAHFRRRPGQLAGEWTPRYLWDPWAVPALVRCAPGARLLVLLRDPVARFRSGLGHAQKTSPVVGADEVNAAFSRGLYAAQLERVLQVVPRERLLVLQLEQCVARPQEQLRRTFDHLGLEDAAVDVDRAADRNRSVTSLSAPADLLASVRAAYRADADRLPALVGDDIDLTLWRDLDGRPDQPA